MSAFAPDCQEALDAIREVSTETTFWEKLIKHYTSENHSDVIIQDNASCVKSLCKFLLLCKIVEYTHASVPLSPSASGRAV